MNPREKAKTGMAAEKLVTVTSEMFERRYGVTRPAAEMA